jgi:hypothetical protein
MGSGNWTASNRSSYTGRGYGRANTPDDADEYEEANNVPELSIGSSRRPGEATATPQFLVEDDLYDDEYGESRLVAPPVLGEAPSSFRDF